MRIEDEIKQKTFVNDYAKAHVNILYTASWLALNAAKSLKPFGLSPHQFNILRILRGAYPGPCSIKQLTERMLDKSSNASRLVDKLIAKNLVTKAKCGVDNRRAEVVITDNGIEVLAKAKNEVDKISEGFRNHLTELEAVQLSNLLDKLRG